MLSSDQDLDCDIVYVDFDELFHADDMEIRPPTGKYSFVIQTQSEATGLS